MKKKVAAILALAMGITIVPKINAQAAIYYGWEKNGSDWYYYTNGSMRTGWVFDNGSWYYLKSNGAMASGWQNVNGTWYYLNSSGAMKTGWLNDNGVWYYLNSDGSMKIGWLKDNTTWYYLNGNGAMKTGWLNDNGKWYYLNNDGSMKTGILKVSDNEAYLLEENGEWIENTGNYYFMVAPARNVYTTNTTKIGVCFTNNSPYDCELDLNNNSLKKLKDDGSWEDVKFKENIKKKDKVNVHSYGYYDYDIDCSDLAEGKLEKGTYRVYNLFGSDYKYVEFKVEQGNDIELELDSDMYYTEGWSNITFFISNSTDKDITVDNKTLMQRLVDGKWQDVPLKKGSYVEGTTTIKKDTREYNAGTVNVNDYIDIDLKDYIYNGNNDYSLQGKYRIVKNINGQDYYAEFNYRYEEPLM